MFIIKCSFDKKKVIILDVVVKLGKTNQTQELMILIFFFIMICIKPDFVHITLHLSQYNPIKIR